MTMEIRCVLEAEASLGEGPIWCPRKGLLYWVDILRGQIHWFDPESREDHFCELDETVGAVALRQEGGLLVALGSTLVFVDPEVGSIELIAAPERHLPRNRFNDGKCDRHGRFWIGSMDTDEVSPSGALYCLDTDRSLTRIFGDVTIGNGLGWSPENDVIYFTDSPLRTIYAMDFDLASARVGPRRVFAEIPAERGFPDGLTVDAEGCVWGAHWDGGCLTRYTPDGRIDRVLELPVPRPTSVAFGGADLDTLYVTSARVGLAPQALAAAPLSGGIFAISGIGCKGLPEPTYRTL
jgi:sugar lactone lactonase YvrE